MADRLKTLKRISAVQEKMVQLSEWRLAIAERTCRTLGEDQLRLQSYVSEETALGVPLARAALRSLKVVDQRLRQAERMREETKAKLAETKLKEQALSNLTEDVRRQVRRVEEDKVLTATLETWLAIQAQACRKAQR